MNCASSWTLFLLTHERAFEAKEESISEKKWGCNLGLKKEDRGGTYCIRISRNIQKHAICCDYRIVQGVTTLHVYQTALKKLKNSAEIYMSLFMIVSNQVFSMLLATVQTCQG